MQHNIDAKKRSTVGVDENQIHFKPSPNFRNMKKFLKSRMGDDPFASPTMESPDSSPSQEEIQPPLPLDPPPQDEHPIAQFPVPMIARKDDKMFYAIPKQERPSPEPETKHEEPAPLVEELKVLKPICKDFIRGSCSRVGCRYRHEVDLAQLRGIFVFCHNFQNSSCERPNCRFVHASVFEEQRFYRTGELPKILVQKPENPTIPPPLPLPPPSNETESPKDPVENAFLPNVSKPPPQISAKSEEQLMNNGMVNNGHVDLKKSPTKRGWLENDEGRTDLLNSSSPHDDEPRVKRNNEARCGSCKVMEHRWKYAVKKLEEIMKSVSESELKISKLQKRHKFLVQIAWNISQSNKKRDQNMGQQLTINLDQVMQQMASLSDCLAQITEDERRNTSTTNLTSQLKQLRHSPANINKITHSEDNGNKAYQLSAQQLVQLDAPSSSNASYQLQTGSVNTNHNEQSPVRLANMSSSRQLSNFLNRW